MSSRPATSCASGSATTQLASRSSATRYRAELVDHADSIDELRARAQSDPLTILYAARDQQHNNAVVVADLVRDG